MLKDASILRHSLGKLVKLPPKSVGTAPATCAIKQEVKVESAVLLSELC
jgi:hypothetical protein